MPSLRSQMLIFLLKHRHLFQGKLRPIERIEESTSIPKLRETVEKGAGSFGKLPRGFVIEPVSIGSLSAEWILPPGSDKRRVLLYFHGGGLVVGSVRSHRGIVAKFVKASGVPALVFDYSLAPEHPFPAALNDSIAAYQYLLDNQIKAEQIVFMGDSGGGNLVFASMLAARDKGLPFPAGAVALSPWTDLTNSGQSWEENAERDKLCWKNAQTVFAEHYIGDHNASNPLISPLFGDFTGFPPILLYAGGHELMLSDSIGLAKKARTVGVQVRLTIGEGLFHCYPAVAPLCPEATEALKEIGEFIAQHTSR